MLDQLPGSEFRQMMKARLNDVGDAKLNADHERLLEFVMDADEILALMLLREGTAREWEALADIMNHLMNYTRTHFEAEETYLRRKGYPKVDEHAAQHAKLVAQLNSSQQRIIAHDDTVSGEVRQWLLEWLFVHINTFDLAYKNHFEQNK